MHIPTLLILILPVVAADLSTGAGHNTSTSSSQQESAAASVLANVSEHTVGIPAHHDDKLVGLNKSETPIVVAPSTAHNELKRGSAKHKRSDSKPKPKKKKPPKDKSNSTEEEQDDESGVGRGIALPMSLAVSLVLLVGSLQI